VGRFWGDRPAQSHQGSRERDRRRGTRRGGNRDRDRDQRASGWRQRGVRGDRRCCLTQPVGDGAGEPGARQPGCGRVRGDGSARQREARRPGRARAEGQELPGPAGGGPARGAGGPRAPRCVSKHIVLSLVVGRPTYPAHVNPQFTINVVSTAKQTCIFDVGEAHLALVIRTVAGQVWSSADCVRGRRSLMSDLAPGVPTAIPVTWNRTASRPGCKADPGRAGSGIYAATAESGSLTSKEAIFRIR